MGGNEHHNLCSVSRSNAAPFEMTNYADFIYPIDNQYLSGNWVVIKGP